MLLQINRKYIKFRRHKNYNIMKLFIFYYYNIYVKFMHYICLFEKLLIKYLNFYNNLIFIINSWLL